jgi:hypothetical protein
MMNSADSSCRVLSFAQRLTDDFEGVLQWSRSILRSARQDRIWSAPDARSLGNTSDDQVDAFRVALARVAERTWSLPRKAGTHKQRWALFAAPTFVNICATPTEQTGIANINDRPATPSDTPHRCIICDGALASPQVLLGGVSPWAKAVRPDYMCVGCRRTYYWRGDPPMLVLSGMRA